MITVTLGTRTGTVSTGGHDGHHDGLDAVHVGHQRRREPVLPDAVTETGAASVDF